MADLSRVDLTNRFMWGMSIALALLISVGAYFVHGQEGFYRDLCQAKGMELYQNRGYFCIDHDKRVFLP